VEEQGCGAGQHQDDGRRRVTVYIPVVARSCYRQSIGTVGAATASRYRDGSGGVLHEEVLAAEDRQ
jgi:hypothetical protein